MDLVSSQYLAKPDAFLEISLGSSVGRYIFRLYSSLLGLGSCAQADPRQDILRPGQIPWTKGHTAFHTGQPSRLHHPVPSVETGFGGAIHADHCEPRVNNVTQKGCGGASLLFPIRHVKRGSAFAKLFQRLHMLPAVRRISYHNVPRRPGGIQRR